MMTMKVACVNQVRLTTEVAENVQKEPPVHLVNPTYSQRTLSDLMPLQMVLRVAAHGLHTSQDEWTMVYCRVYRECRDTLMMTARLASNATGCFPV